MAMYVGLASVIRQLKAERQASGADRFDEVWDNVYVMAPLPNDEHQAIASSLGAIFMQVAGWPGLGEARVGTNVSDREKGWKHKYRCPDVACFLKGTRARNSGTHWLGGPDCAVEIVSPGDRSREKLTFYGQVGVRELLLIDRKPWALELYRNDEGVLRLVGKSTAKRRMVLTSEVLPLSFQLERDAGRFVIVVTHHDGVQQWRV